MPLKKTKTAKKTPLQKSQGKTFYVTTPLYYVNASPHAGSLYTTLAADVLARYYRTKLGPESVFFTTGTDEYGQKVTEYAEKAGLDPKEFADSMVPEYEKAWKMTNISYDHFFRTTDQRHIDEVHKVFTKIHEAGYIYKGTYEGLYCVGCEKFITESDAVDGRCPYHPDKELIKQKENNYFFKLSEFASQLLAKIKADEYKILPEKRKNEIMSRIEQGVDDISISRENVKWGIPVPWDEGHTFYVWVEALFNYYTATRFLEDRERFWPADVHLMAKEILWFHAVIWEALLMAADLPLPKRIFAHGFFTINGQKMSKSLGNVITPVELVERYGTDGTRYVLLSAFQFGNDGDISQDKFDAKYNADLAHGLGNLVARTAKLCEGLDVSVARPSGFSGDFAVKLEALSFDKALEDVWNRIRETDKYINENEPWGIDDDAKKARIMKPAVEKIVQIAYDLRPFMPEFSEGALSVFCDGDSASGVVFKRVE